MGIARLFAVQAQNAAEDCAVVVLLKFDLYLLRPRKEADDLIEFLFQKGGLCLQHRITPLYLRSKESAVFSPWPGYTV